MSNTKFVIDISISSDAVLDHVYLKTANESNVIQCSISGYVYKNKTDFATVYPGTFNRKNALAAQEVLLSLNNFLPKTTYKCYVDAFTLTHNVQKDAISAMLKEFKRLAKICSLQADILVYAILETCTSNCSGTIKVRDAFLKANCNFITIPNTQQTLVFKVI